MTIYTKLLNVLAARALCNCSSRSGVLFQNPKAQYCDETACYKALS